MGEIKGNRHLSGTFGQIWYNGVLIAEMNKISVKVTANREEVQTGLSVDSKVVGVKGEGTITLIKTYTRFEDVRMDILKGRDPRGVIIAKLQDPDAEGGQTERWQIGNVALSEFGFEWEKGAVIKQEIPFTFTPTDMICLDKVS